MLVWGGGGCRGLFVGHYVFLRVIHTGPAILVAVVRREHVEKGAVLHRVETVEVVRPWPEALGAVSRGHDAVGGRSGQTGPPVHPVVATDPDTPP